LPITYQIVGEKQGAGLKYIYKPGLIAQFVIEGKTLPRPVWYNFQIKKYITV
jgi:hypothetical protein